MFPHISGSRDAERAHGGGLLAPVWHVRSFAVLMMSLEKVNNQKSTTLLRSIREMKLQGKLLPLRVLETDKQIQRMPIYWNRNPRAKSPLEPVLG